MEDEYTIVSNLQEGTAPTALIFKERRAAEAFFFQTVEERGGDPSDSLVTESGESFYWSRNKKEWERGTGVQLTPGVMVSPEDYEIVKTGSEVH